MAQDGRKYSIIPIALARDTTLSICAHRVATGLGMYMNQEGHCWPTTATLCQDLGLSERAIRRGIAELVARGYVRRKRRYNQSSTCTWLDPAVNGPSLGRSVDATDRVNGQMD